MMRQRLARGIVRVTGYRMVSEVPQTGILVGAPRTSNDASAGEHGHRLLGRRGQLRVDRVQHGPGGEEHHSSHAHEEQPSQDH